MLNQGASEALYSATYVENFLDCLENLPDDLQRQLSRLRELDSLYQGHLSELEGLATVCMDEQLSENASRRRNVLQMQQTLIKAQEIGDEKLQAVQTLQDLIENQARLLETDHSNVGGMHDFGKDQENTEPNSKEVVSIHTQSHTVIYSSSGSSGACGASNSGGTSSFSATSGGNSADQRQSKRARRSRVEIVEETFLNITASQGSSSGERAVETRGASETPKSGAGGSTVSGVASSAGASASAALSSAQSSSAQRNKTAKKKKRKSKQDKDQRQQQQRRQQQDDSPQEMPIDPDEPTYCLCDQISYGEMILCDNDLCPIEWFHFSCVALTSKPKGKWFCPRCRGDRPNVMKPKAQFLKELERYNKEKEEKA